MKRVYLASLGCPKALVDSEIMLGLLKKEGYIPVSHPREADILLVNTCAFIREATEESIETILSLAKGKTKTQLLVVAGCLPQRYGREIEKVMEEVDLWVNLHSLERLPDLLKGMKVSPTTYPFLPHHSLPRQRITPSTWTYLKIAEGCNNRCAYCTIPSIRGALRSRTLEDLVAEAEKLAEDGVVELNLIAQDITRYGEDLGLRHGLLELLDALEKIEGLQWIRLMYAHPAGVTRELAERLGQGKVLPYLEMPIQHIDDKVLESMGRRGGKKAVIEALERLTARGEMFLRTTVMVGFPTEGEKEFQELMDFLGKAPIFRLAAFAYSPEEGTPAAEMDQLPQKERLDRLNQVLALQEELHYARNLELVGRKFPILLEEPGWGRFPGQAPEIDGRVKLQEVERKSLMEALITDADGVDLFAKNLLDPKRLSKYHRKYL
ncbi:MAG TPA: 30S ribosomal protein S12 methylthiotransferase RimO [Thermosulfidibacter takaii]|uniref:Ribosomal protein uS12 methylthiotransferase RimO n=1 Tax=Thermosulfidibacter takaii TaxID=412593 RepID=A0A7C0U5N6_9BACT|nr:30S ribosomal protein S12 methylthiotransferase RimO [Thermosulfidibacter takaii]